MKTFCFLCGYILLVLGVVAGCQAATVNSIPASTETRAIDPFDTVVLATSGAMTILPGATKQLTITAPGNVLPWIETRVVNGLLRAAWKAGAPEFATGTPITYMLSAPTLLYLTVKGPGRVEANDVHADRIEVTVTGTGQIVMHRLDAVDLAADLDGGGQMEFSGAVQTQDVSIPGAGQYMAAELASRDTSISVAGTGHAVVQAADLLDVRITGPGTVEYYGDPRLGLYVTSDGKLIPLGTK